MQSREGPPGAGGGRLAKMRPDAPSGGPGLIGPA